MDKNTSIGLLLMLLMTIGFMYITKPTDEEILAQKQKQEQIADSLSQVNQQALEQSTTTVEPIALDSAQQAKQDSIMLAQKTSVLGIFGNLSSGSNTTKVLENEVVKATFNSKGGKIASVELKDFVTYDDQSLILIDDDYSKMSMNLKQQGKDVNLYDLYFQESLLTKKGDTSILTFTAKVLNGNTIKQIYTLAPNDYKIGYTIDLGNANGIDNSDIVFDWKQKYKRVERRVEGYLESKKKSGINYYTDGMETIGEGSEDFEEESTTNLKWFAHKQKFFVSSLISDQTPFKTAKLSIDPTMAADTSYIKTAHTNVTLNIDQIKAKNNPLNFYFGPNNYGIMGDVTEDFQDNVYLGLPFVSWVNKLIIIPVFHFLEGFIDNYGIIILLLVFIIKLALSPLSYKSYKGMAKMRVLKPELDAIKEQYPDDMQKQQSEQMKLYGQFGISPLSGCVPMLLQMPILFAMFYFFPNSVELRQEAFLWAEDLSTYDDFISFGATSLPIIGNHLSLFTVLMTVTSIFSTWMNNQMTTVQGPMKNIGYIMPIGFFFVLNSYPAALTFYYFVSNLVTFAQQMIIKKTINEDKIRKGLEENKRKQGTRKKSGWRKRLDDAMKAQQEMQNQKKKK